jgi:hypothetical protein
MDLRDLQRLCAEFPVAELRKHDRRWVAFSADGWRIVGSAESLAQLENDLEAAGEDAQAVGLEWIEFEDSSPGAAGLL